MDLGQPHSWRTLVGRELESCRDCSDCAECASAHAPGLQSTLWILRTRTLCGLELQTTRLDERVVIMVGRCLHLAAVCTHIHSLVCPLPCMVGRFLASDWISFGEAPCNSMLPSALQAIRADSVVSLTLTVPHFATRWKATLGGRVEYEKRAKKRHQPNFLLIESISANCQVPLSIPWRTPPQSIAANIDDST